MLHWVGREGALRFSQGLSLAPPPAHQPPDKSVLYYNRFFQDCLGLKLLKKLVVQNFCLLCMCEASESVWASEEESPGSGLHYLLRRSWTDRKRVYRGIFNIWLENYCDRKCDLFLQCQYFRQYILKRNLICKKKIKMKKCIWVKKIWAYGWII